MVKQTPPLFSDGRKETLRLRPKNHFWLELESPPSEDVSKLKHEDVGKRVTFTTSDRCVSGVVTGHLSEVNAHVVSDDAGFQWFVTLDLIPHAWDVADHDAVQKFEAAPWVS
eukprot:jgi/Pico_ML_1/50785/g1932.t1